jgi:uncharacterized protein YeaO (DUF488 family)
VTAFVLKRVYDPPEPDAGTRVLVDRLWPRGLSKEKARIDLWLKDNAPSDALRKRFHGKTDDWAAFQAAYREELLDEKALTVAEILYERLRAGPVSLLYAARDERHNNALALKLWLEQRMHGPT